MNNLTKEQMLELAKIVYPGQQVLERDYHVMVRPRHGENSLPDPVRFDPSLTGEDWQKAQALDVIVAAFNLPRRIGITKAYDLGGVETYIAETKDWGRVCPDLLTAASLALISGGRS